MRRAFFLAELSALGVGEAAFAAEQGHADARQDDEPGARDDKPRAFLPDCQRRHARRDENRKPQPGRAGERGILQRDDAFGYRGFAAAETIGDPFAQSRSRCSFRPLRDRLVVRFFLRNRSSFGRRGDVALAAADHAAGFERSLHGANA